MIAPDGEELTIKTGGQVLGGWLELTVARGVEQLPSYCEVRLTEVSPTAPAIVTPGESCEVFLGRDKILTGYIDTYAPEVDKDGHEVRMVCRSKTEDLVDCCPDTDTLGWHFRAGGDGGSIGAAAKQLAAQYGIKVMLPDGDAPLPPGSYFDIHAGYTVYFLIEEMARSVGMLVWDDVDGNLVISKGGTGGRAGSALILGQNIEHGRFQWSVGQRYSDYKVLSQAPDLNGHLNIVAKAKDPEITRFRLRTIPQEVPDISQTLSQRRAEWEKNRRYGRGRLTQVVVTGWRDGNGALWRPNSNVYVSMPPLHVDRDLVIVATRWRRGDYGTLTEIDCMPVEALTVEPFAAQAPVPELPKN